MKKLLFLVNILILTVNCKVSALSYGGCNYSDVSRMKSLVSNVNISYDYHMENAVPYFDLTINNIVPEIYFYDNVNRKNYYYSDTNNGEITIYNYTVESGNLSFYSNLSECYGIKLGSKYYNFPVYNQYYMSDVCSDVPNYNLCQKWTDVNYTYSEFETKVLEYKNRILEDEKDIKTEYEKSFLDVIIQLYIDYYYVFLGSIILICAPIIFIKNKNNKFDL